MVSITYDPEGLISATILLGPIVLGVAALRASSRRRWLIPLLSAPALLGGLAFTLAVLRDGAGYGGIWLLLYGPILLLLGVVALSRWYLRGRETG